MVPLDQKQMRPRVSWFICPLYLCRIVRTLVSTRSARGQWGVPQTRMKTLFYNNVEPKVSPIVGDEHKSSSVNFSVKDQERMRYFLRTEEREKIDP